MKLPLPRRPFVVAITALGLAIPTVLLLNGGVSKARPPAVPAVSSNRIAGRSEPVEPRFHPTAEASAPQPAATSAPAPAAPASRAAAPTATATRPVPAAPPPVVAGLPAFTHVFTIVMENEESSSVLANPAAPYLNGLAARYGLATNYYAISHPSLPNYLALTSGSTFGITSDCTSCYVNASNIADQVEASGRSWRAYMEDMPAACYGGPWSGNYAMKHDPFMYYNDIRNDPARCASHVVPFTQFAPDLGSGHLPNYVFITPNMCHDMHDCGVGTGDAWLRTVVPGILGSSAYQNGGVLFITWDEGASSAGCCGNSWGGRVVTLVVSPTAIPGYRSGVAENHYSLLRTIEDAWHLGRLGGAAYSGAMREYFRN